MLLICLAGRIHAEESFHERQTAVPQESCEPSSAPALPPAAEASPEPEPEPAEEALGIEAGLHYGKHQQETAEYGGQYLEYNVMVPENATEGMPLIIYLPGDNSNDRLNEIPEREFALRVKEIYGDDFPFILCLPCTRWFEWHDGWIAEVLKGLIDEVAAEYRVDSSKICLTGYSRGAVGCWGMVNDLGSYFSCAVPVSCGGTVKNTENFAEVPLWAIASDGAGDAGYLREIKSNVEKINENGGAALLTIIEGSDHAYMGYDAYSKEVIEWMLGC